jgi:hypothetical protein
MPIPHSSRAIKLSKGHMQPCGIQSLHSFHATAFCQPKLSKFTINRTQTKHVLVKEIRSDARHSGLDRKSRYCHWSQVSFSAVLNLRGDYAKISVLAIVQESDIAL